MTDGSTKEGRVAQPLFRAFGPDTDAWDLAVTGAPGVGMVARAVQVWSVLQGRRTTVAQAGEVFNLPPGLIVDAVEWHPWMELSGPRDDYGRLTIEHEGE